MFPKAAYAKCNRCGERVAKKAKKETALSIFVSLAA
jgi:hypothetical protein